MALKLFARLGNNLDSPSPEENNVTLLSSMEAKIHCRF
jgi:hypothetical protein